MNNACKNCGKKGQRHCPATEDWLCSKCCGIKRGKEIFCTPTCEFIPNPYSEHFGEIDRIVSQSFNSEEEDIYQKDEKYAKLAYMLEAFFLSYDIEIGVNADTIAMAVKKLYLFWGRQVDKLDYDNDFEKVFFDILETKEAQDIIKKLNSNERMQVAIRILKSIRSTCGGIFTNRGYLMMLKSQLGKYLENA